MCTTTDGYRNPRAASPTGRRPEVGPKARGSVVISRSPRDLTRKPRRNLALSIFRLTCFHSTAEHTEDVYSALFSLFPPVAFFIFNLIVSNSKHYGDGDTAGFGVGLVAKSPHSGSPADSIGISRQDQCATVAEIERGRVSILDCRRRRTTYACAQNRPQCLETIQKCRRSCR